MEPSPGSSEPPGRGWRTAARVALVAGSLAGAELLLHGAARVWPAVAALTDEPVVVAPVIPGPGGEIRGDPAHPDHDDAGFRNAGVPGAPAVVALGDSHTWGNAVGRAEAWPARLGEGLGAPVYNMGLPTWGVRHYEDALSGALALAPRAVVVAVYLGNDLYDDFLYMGRSGLLEAELAPEEVERISALEADGSIEEEARHLFRAGDPAPAPLALEESSPAARVRALLSAHSRLYGVARALRRRLAPVPAASGLMDPDFRAAAAAVTGPRTAHVSAFEDAAWRTLLTARYRALVLNTRDPRIEAGLGSTTAALARMASRVEAERRRFLVVLLPTKESVFAPRIAEPGRHPGLSALVEAEASVRTRLTVELEARGIQVLDPLEALRRAPVQPYFENVDGHPSPGGHAVIAREVASALARPHPPAGR